MVRTVTVALPKPAATGPMSVEEAIARRRSVRDYAPRPLTIDALSQVMWAAQGVTDVHGGLRAAPSAGALYPLELYVSVREGGVVDLGPGVYHYGPDRHAVTLTKSGDCSSQLTAAAYDQEQVGLAAVSIVIAGVIERASSKYGERAAQYVFQESGHAAENVYLQSTALGLATVVMGAFDEYEVRRAVGLGPKERPLCMMPVGFPRP